MSPGSDFDFKRLRPGEAFVLKANSLGGELEQREAFKLFAPYCSEMLPI